MTPFSAVLLAAGRSGRMGRDKALIEISPGRTLWERQWALLSEVGADEKFLSVRSDQAWAPESTAKIFDAMPGLGPFGGLAAALAKCRHPHLLVLAVDLPMMTADWLREMLEQRKSARGVVPVLHGNFEPLAAIYSREIMPLLPKAISEKEFSLQRLLAKAASIGLMAEMQVASEHEAFFANWNEPGDVT